MYKEVRMFGNVCAVIRLEDNAYIPFDKGNFDYIAYLEWIELGNHPIPAND